MKPIYEKSWMHHLSKDENVVCKLVCDPYTLLFLVMDINEDEGIIQYHYRILCFFEEMPYPVLAVNLESSYAGIFLGVHTHESHINLGGVNPGITFDGFILEAQNVLPRYLPNLDTELLQDKITTLFNTLKQSKAEQQDEQGIENVMNIGEFRAKKLRNITKNIREYSDRYEYCLISEYEEKFDQFQAHSIQLGDIFVVLLETEEKVVLVSLEFYKDRFERDDIVAWFNFLKIYMGRQDHEKHVINNVSRVCEVIKFKGNLIVSYYKGYLTQEIDPDDYDEITETFLLNQQDIDTRKSKPINEGLTIKINDRIVDKIPRIEFDMSKDIVLSNGNFIVADYIDEYCGSIGFYKEEDNSIPIVFFLDHETMIDIQIISKEDDSKICIVEHQYLIDIDRL
jgi:hypothetical protein